MKADFSRATFDHRKHHRRVLMQQGRVEVDADSNEQIAIDVHITDSTTRDVIGQCGVPLLPNGTLSTGFQITLDTAGNLDIGTGRIYVDGILVENENVPTTATYLVQPSRPFPTGMTLAQSPDLSQGSGVYLVYLDVWERLVTAVDDPLIRETALGGPDHSVRSQIVWQVKLARLGDLTGVFTCATTGDGWIPKVANPGQLTASVGAPAADPLPCILPPETGYRRLENQLYRVEIHEGGGYGAARFKWSRENGSVIAGVIGVPGANPQPATVAGPSFLVTTTGRDDSLGFHVGDWVELIDDRAELLNGRGELLQVQLVDTANLVITTTTAASAGNSVDLSLHPKLRRWDETGAGLDDGIVIPDGQPIALEEGIQVAFSAGTFSIGDYWLIPARTRTSVTAGQIEWPNDPMTNLPAALLPRGIEHHYAKLAVVGFDGTNFQLIGGVIPDCRPGFPPLTGLQPCTGSSPCTVVVQPGAGWEKPVLALFTNPGVNAEICFPVGQFPVTQTVNIGGGGNIKVVGAGAGTQLTSSTVESIMRFTNCTSVIVRDLAASTAAVDPLPGPSEKGPKPFDQRDHLNGTLHFVDCGEVIVDSVSLRCGGASFRGAACLTARSTITDANATTGVGSVRVRGSRFLAGDLQYGILIVHAARAVIEDNEIAHDTASAKRIPITRFLEDPILMSMARSLLLSHPIIELTAAQAEAAAARRQRRARPAAAAPLARETELVPAEAAGNVAPPATPPAGNAPPGSRPNVTVTIGNRTVSFRSLPGLESTWQAFLTSGAPANFATERDFMQFLSASAKRVLIEPALREQFAGFRSAIHLLGQSETMAAARGIAIGGRSIQDLQIRGNGISGALQGIAVGMSFHQPSGPDKAGSILIADNVIDVVLSPLGRRLARHAIFVGNVDSVEIRSNRARLSDPSRVSLPTDGIRAFGYFGKKLIVRGNHLTGFPTGVRVTALSAPGAPVTKSTTYRPGIDEPPRSGNLWLIADNVLDKSSQPISAPACMQVDNWD
jgi:hypothetical protein